MLDRRYPIIIQLPQIMQVYLAGNSGCYPMKDERKLLLNFAAVIVAGLLFAILPISCASTGNVTVNSPPIRGRHSKGGGYSNRPGKRHTEYVQRAF
jgi:hypothetical protein